VEAKTTVADRLDALDKERFEDMIASPPFALFVRRIAAELARAQNDCERKDETVSIYRAQGAAAAFRVALALPELIVKEIRANVSR
jgi:hypothetical protein